MPIDTLSALESPGDVDPPEDSAYPRVVHQIMLVDRGINLIENMYLDELVRDKVYEFLFILAAPKLKGGTAFPSSPSRSFDDVSVGASLSNIHVDIWMRPRPAQDRKHSDILKFRVTVRFSFTRRAQRRCRFGSWTILGCL